MLKYTHYLCSIYLGLISFYLRTGCWTAGEREDFLSRRLTYFFLTPDLKPRRQPEQDLISQSISKLLLLGK